MISLHISGKLIRNPETKTSSKGTPYVQALVSVSHGDGDLLVTVMAFDSGLQSLLSGLQKGDSLSAIGAGSVRAYTGKDGSPATGVTVMAARIMAIGEAKSQPRKKDGNGNGHSVNATHHSPPAYPGAREQKQVESYDDDIPF